MAPSPRPSPLASAPVTIPRPGHRGASGLGLNPGARAPTVRSGDGCSRLSRRSAQGSHARLPARSRRDQGRRHARHPGRARRRLPDRRRLLPPRQLLRPVGLPHHLAADRGMAHDGHHQARRVLGSPRPAAAPRPLRSCSIGVAIIYGIFVPAGTYPTLRGDALSALFYVANWHYIASGSNYFHMTGLTSPLIHTWSLAVEEQFYLVWPLVFLGVLKLTRSLADPPRRCGRRRAGLRHGDGPPLQPDEHQPPLLRHRHPCAVRVGRGDAGHRPAPVGRTPPEG